MPPMSSAPGPPGTGPAPGSGPGSSSPAAPLDLKRVIGFWDASALVVGLIIGSGIFRSPASVAQELPSAWLMLAAWVVGGLLSLLGGLAAAELGVRYPRHGGQYVFLKEAFGPAVSFAYGWSNVLIARPSVLSGISIVFATYWVGLFGFGAETQKLWAMAAAVVFTFVNCLGVKEGTRTQNAFTLTKVVGLALLTIAALFSGRGDVANLTAAAPALEHSFFVAMGLGLVTILYTYDGWIDLTYVGGEVKNPNRDLPRAILLGTVTCMVLYLIANVSYLLFMTPAEMAGYENIGAVALDRAFGPVGGQLLGVLVVVSTLGILNGAILSGARVPYAMARDGMLFSTFGKLNARTESPVNVLVAQGIFTVIVIWFSSGFEQVASLFVSVTWFFYAVNFIGLLVLQRREKRTGVASGESVASGATFRMPMSPWPAVVFVLVTFFVIGCDLVFGGPQVLIGLGLVGLGVPIYWLWKGRKAVR